VQSRHEAGTSLLRAIAVHPALYELELPLPLYHKTPVARAMLVDGLTDALQMPPSATARLVLREPTDSSVDDDEATNAPIEVGCAAAAANRDVGPNVLRKTRDAIYALGVTVGALRTLR